MGTITLLFTDIEGSTKLWEAHPDLMRLALARHDDLMRQTIVGANGFIFKTMGDAFCAAFAKASDAVSAGLAVQRAIVVEPWPEATPIKVRMALHTGAVECRDDDYFGATLSRVARLLATGHGGQTLLSQATYDLAHDTLPDTAVVRGLGAHQLKDLAQPEQVFQLCHPDLPGDFPPIKSLSTHPNNLPQQLTSFIGREKEITEIKALLAGTRLLTLVGSGGSGKTRLSLHVAADSLEQFPDGAWFVELASLADAALVPQTVASVLGVKEELGKPIVQALIEQLRPKRLLLLLDNCEHLLDGCAQVVDALVRQCAGVKILASSREALGIAGEQTYRVPSLSLPDRKQEQTPQSLSQYETVRLFIDRALLVRPNFQVTQRNAPALASLCHQLDGIPLAIELAAARVRTLSVEEIDGKLDQRFRLLTGGSRTALPRQQTLRSLIDWSYDLLRDQEKLLLQRLAVFAGGWTLAAAERVGAGDGVDEREVFDLLTSLADKSLVVAEQMDEHSRYRLLETVGQYANDRLLESDGADAIRRRHRDHFLALAEEAEPKLLGAEQAEWLRRLEEEHENLRAGLGWSLLQSGSGEGLRLCGALQRFWTTRGHLAEGREWCMRFLGKAGGEKATLEQAKVLNAAGSLAYFQGDYPAARARHEESLAIKRQLGDRKGMAASLGNLGNVASDRGDFAAARALYEESLAIMREIQDLRGVSTSLNNLGNVACEQRDFLAARALYEEFLAITRALGDRIGIARALNNLASAAYEQGDFASARALNEESLAIRKDLGDRAGMADSLENMGNLCCEQRDYPTAGVLHREGLTIRHALGDRGRIATSLAGVAAVEAAIGNVRRAACIWGAAERLREDLGSSLSPKDRPRYDFSVAAARAALGDDAAFDGAWEDGRTLTLEHAMVLALSSTVGSG